MNVSIETMLTIRSNMLCIINIQYFFPSHITILGRKNNVRKKWTKGQLFKKYLPPSTLLKSGKKIRKPRNKENNHLKNQEIYWYLKIQLIKLRQTSLWLMHFS